MAELSNTDTAKAETGALSDSEFHQAEPDRHENNQFTPTSLTRHNGVVVDILHIIAVVKHVDELFEHRQIIPANLDT